MALPRLHDDRPTKVGELQLWHCHAVHRGTVQEEVFGLDIPVFHTLLNQVPDRQQQLLDELQDEDLQHAAPVVGGIQLVDIPTITVLQHQDVLVVSALVALQQAQDVRVDSDGGEGAELLLEHHGARSVEALEGDPSASCPSLHARGGMTAASTLVRGAVGRRAPELAAVEAASLLGREPHGERLEDRGRLPRPELAAENVPAAPV
mmetsp:Transcript_135160/g.420058  ORF Transcript_135160/g.420058 Transcript_135160/m.420058 type:complete len:206 (-) Transcript_135160:302-919(-)